MPRKTVILSVAQIRQGDDLPLNLREITRAIEEARAAKADIVAFPECALTGYGPALHKSTESFASAGEVAAGLKEIRATARAANLAVVLGTHLPLEDGWSNSLVLISPAGRLLNRYDKTHLYGRDIEYYRAGRAQPTVSGSKGARIGLQLCFDIRFPEPFRLLALGGAEILFVPSYIHGRNDMWKGPVVESHVSSRAAENGRFVVFTNAAGKAQNVPSMIANPRGEIIARARRGARQFLTVRIALDEVNNEYLSCRRTYLY